MLYIPITWWHISFRPSLLRISVLLLLSSHAWRSTSEGVAANYRCAVRLMLMLRWASAIAVDFSKFRFVGGTCCRGLIRLCSWSDYKYYTQNGSIKLILQYSRTPLIRPPSESHWCGRIRGMVAREGFILFCTPPMKMIHLRHLRNKCVYCINAWQITTQCNETSFNLS